MSKIYPSGVKQTSEQRMHSFLTETLLKRVSAVVDRSTGENGATSQSQSTLMSGTKSTDARKSAPRSGGIESYRIDSNVVDVIKPSACIRGYKVLTFIENERGVRTVFDLLTGTIYNTGRKERLTKGGVMFKTKSAALSERFSPRALPLTNSKLPTSRYPRVLCQFDAWGKVHNRFGGVPAAEYEYMKFMGVVQFVDPICPHSQSSVDVKIEPNFFGKPCDFAAPRNSSPIAIKLRTKPLSGN